MILMLRYALLWLSGRGQAELLMQGNSVLTKDKPNKELLIDTKVFCVFTVGSPLP
jgi:hypothetical protein